TVGHALHFITTLDRPEMVGVNPEVAHETMAGLSFLHGVGQALWAGKLFHIDLNAQRIGRYDQDFRFGAEDLKEAFLLVRLLERSGYDGARHFDALPEVADALAASATPELAQASCAGAGEADALKVEADDLDALARR